MNKAVVIFLFVLLTLLLFNSVYGDNVIVYVYPNVVEKSVNSSFDVEIRIANVVGLYGYELKVYFNSSLLHAVSLTKGTFFPDSNILEFKKEINNINGYVWYAVSLLNPETPKSGSGSLIKVSFNTLNVEGNSTLSLQDVMLGDINANPISFSVSNGQVMITKTATTPPGTITPGVTSVKFDIITITSASHVFLELPFALKRTVTMTFIIQPTRLDTVTIGADAIVNWWIVENNTRNVILNQTLTVYCDTDNPKTVTIEFSVPEGDYTFFAKVVNFGSYNVEENLSTMQFSIGNALYDWLFTEKNILFIIIVVIVLLILFWRYSRH